MKVYNIPEDAPQAPGWDVDDWEKAEADHAEALKEWLIEQGYTGTHTGGIVHFPVADGHASYMLADGKGRYGNSFLIHLPYGDAWNYQGIQHFPKKAIVEQLKKERRYAAAR